MKHIPSSGSPAERAAAVLDRLAQRYPDPKPALNHGSPWELLVATILSAQCTDERVNQVTPVLFQRWPDIPTLSSADLAEVEEVVRSTGFFRQKAKNLIATARIILEEFEGELPRTMADMIRLPGVARKTANIVLSNSFGVNEGVAVDTHVKRLSFRLGFTESQDPAVIERELMALIPQEAWGRINHYLVFLGREICMARKPKCPACPQEDLCPKHGV